MFPFYKKPLPSTKKKTACDVSQVIRESGYVFGPFLDNKRDICFSYKILLQKYEYLQFCWRLKATCAVA